MLLGIGLIVMVMGLFVWAQNPSESSETPLIQPRPVKSMIIKKKSEVETRTFPGLVNAAGETRLAFRVSGTLQEMKVVTGQRVKKDQVIACIDPRDYKINVIRLAASLEEARASLEAMKNGARKEDLAALTAQVKAGRANLLRSQKELARFDQLIQKQIITTARHDKAVADFRTSKTAYETAVQNFEKARKGARKEDVLAAEARIKQIKANLAAGENALSDTVLKAPFDGVVNNRFVEKYEAIGTGQSIVSLLDFATVDVKSSIPEEMMLKRFSFTRISCTLEAYPGEVFIASIKELGLKTSKANQSFPLTVSLEIPENLDIQPGMTASLEIEFPREKGRTRGFFLPAGAVFSDSNGLACAWKIDPVRFTVSKIQIKTDRVKDEEVLVIAGLQKGDRIVTAGAGFLIQGQEVRLLNKPQGN